MPQLNFNTFLSQFFWLAIVFFLLYLLLARFIVPKFIEIFQTRTDKIEKFLLEAKDLRDRALALENEYNLMILKAKEESSEIIKDTIEQIKNEMESSNAELTIEISARIKQSELKMETIKQNLMSEFDQVSEDLVNIIYKKLTSHNVDPSYVDILKEIKYSYKEN